MAHVTADRIYETSTTTGLGAYALAGAVTGFRAFSSAGAIGDTCHYVAFSVDSNGNGNGDWEIGLGQLASGSLTRLAVVSSSNANAPVNWTAGTRRVAITTINAVTSIATIDFGVSGSVVSAALPAPWAAQGMQFVVSVNGFAPDHPPSDEDVLLEGLIAQVLEVVNGVSVTVAVHAPSGTWGRYAVQVKGA